MDSEDDDADFYDAPETIATAKTRHRFSLKRRPSNLHRKSSSLSVQFIAPATDPTNSNNHLPTPDDSAPSNSTISTDSLPATDENALGTAPRNPSQPRGLSRKPQQSASRLETLHISTGRGPETESDVAFSPTAPSGVTGFTGGADAVNGNGRPISPSSQFSNNGSITQDSKERVGGLSIAQAASLGPGISVNDDGTVTIMLKNLDTNQMVPLAEVEEELKRGIDPLSLHMLKRTGSGAGLLGTDATDSDGDESGQESDGQAGRKTRTPHRRLLNFLKRSSKSSKSSKSSETGGLGGSPSTPTNQCTPASSAFPEDDYADDGDGENTESTMGLHVGMNKEYIKVKVRHKRHRQLARLFLCQELNPNEKSYSREFGQQPPHEHPGIPNVAATAANATSTTTHQPQTANTTQTQQPSAAPPSIGAIWTMKFSKDGKYLATGGQDTIVRVWALVFELESSSGTQNPQNADGTSSNTTPSSPSLRNLNTTSQGILQNDKSKGSLTSINSSKQGQASRGNPSTPVTIASPIVPNFRSKNVFKSSPLHEYKGHTADVLDLSWSKNNFLLSSSMDKTVRLWHTTRKECLCCFQHLDFVTAIAFHPRDDRFFVSGSLDCKLRLWNIPEKKVACWNELPDGNLITAVGFTLDGKMAVAGSYIGLCLFYETENLKYNTQIHVKSSRRGAKGRKITGIEAMPGTAPGEEKLLITSNDSRIRLYNMRDKSLECKYKGLENTSSQIRATFSDDGKYIICGSEDRDVYVWNTDSSSYALQRSSISSATNEPTSASSVSGVRQHVPWLKSGRSPAFESFEAHSHIVTVAVFAPTRTKQLLAAAGDPLFNFAAGITDATADPGSLTYPDGDIILSADYTGCIRVFRNDPCIRHSSFNQESDTASVQSTASSLKDLLLHPRQSFRFLRRGSVGSAKNSPLQATSVWNNSSPSVVIGVQDSEALSGVPLGAKSASFTTLESSTASYKSGSGNARADRSPEVPKADIAAASSNNNESEGVRTSNAAIQKCPSCGGTTLKSFSVLDEQSAVPGKMLICVGCSRVVTGV